MAVLGFTAALPNVECGSGHCAGTQKLYCAVQCIVRSIVSFISSRVNLSSYSLLIAQGLCTNMT